MIKEAVSLPAYAKINVHLEVLNRRKDGFHEIVSIFQLISLSDELLIEKTAEQKSCSVQSPLEELPLDNTIVKAYEEFSALTGIQTGINIKILKRIPSGAGLGGGSSDAAAVLLGLNRLFDSRLSVSELKKAALNIGSDVPFFLEYDAALVTGRGECLQPVNIQNDFFGVLVFDDIESSTKEAYRMLGNSSEPKKASFNPADFCGSDCKNWPFFNSFETPLFKVFPAIKEVKQSLLSLGADFALMSGAGSSVFGLFKDELTAKNAFFRLFFKYKRCFLFLPLAL